MERTAQNQTRIPSLADWQGAADAAMRVLMLASARRHGLIHARVDANEQQAEHILRICKRWRIEPNVDAAERFAIDAIRRERKRLYALLMIGLEIPPARSATAPAPAKIRP
jgi:hypothetical protein